MPELIGVSGHKNPQRRGDVVFVHGLNGNAGDYWGHPGTYWPEWVAEDLSDIGVWSLGYENAAFRKRSGPFGWFLPNQGFAMPLTDRALSVLLTFETNEIGSKPLVFVTHSMGGLLVKQLLRSAGDGPSTGSGSTLLGNTKGVCFIATPHIGSDIAKYVKYFKILLNANISVDQLRPHEPLLRDLQGWYANYVTRKGIDTKTISFYEMKPTFKNLKVVEPGDANPGIPQAQCYPLDDDHRSICKPNSKNADIHKKLVKFINDCFAIGTDPDRPPSIDSVHKDQKADSTGYPNLKDGPLDFPSKQLDAGSAELARVKTQIDHTASHSTGSKFDIEIDKAELCLNNSDLNRAEFYFDEINRQHWEELSRQQKLRLKLGLANVAFNRRKEYEAGKLLLQAKEVYPDSDRAQINEALGLELMGLKSESHILAAKLLSTYPTSSKLLAIFIRTAGTEFSLDTLAKKASGLFAKDPEVYIALSIRAMNAKAYEAAIGYARDTVKNNPEWFGGHFILSQVLLNKGADAQVRRVTASQIQHGVEAFKEAVEVMTGAIELSNRQHINHMLSDCFLVRALAQVQLDEKRLAEDDFRESLRLDPDNPTALHRFALFLSENHKRDEAIFYLRRAVLINDEFGIRHSLANVLASRGYKNDDREAADLCVNLVENTKVENEQENLEKILFISKAAFYNAIELLLNLNSLQEASSFIDGASQRKFYDLSICLGRSKVQLKQGDIESVRASVDNAIHQLTDFSHILDLRVLAVQLDSLGRHKEALPLWLKIKEMSPTSNEDYNLVKCAEKLERHDVILNVARETRRAGIYNPWLLHKEIAILENIDVESAVVLLEDRLASHPADKLARLMLSSIGLRWHRPELVDVRPEALPPVSEARPADGELAVALLQQYGNTAEALNYAYELVRRYPDDATANSTYVKVFFDSRSKPLPALVVSGVDIGTAVRFKEKDGKENWAIIEDSLDPKSSYNEYSPSHELARSLLGHFVGDSVSLAKTSGRDRTGVIMEIMPKYVHKMQNIIRDWQLNFPDESFIQVFNVMGSEALTNEAKPNFDDLKILADRRFEQSNQILKLYKENLIPFHVFSSLAGFDPLFGVCFVAEHLELPFRCNRCGEADLRNAVKLLNEAETLVLDISAIAMLWMLRTEKILAHWPGQILLSQSTSTELRSAKLRLQFQQSSTGHFGKNERGYYLQEVHPDTRKAQFEAFDKFAKSILDSCKVVGCPSLADLDPEKRTKLIEIFGQHGLESMLLARPNSCILWTDDLIVNEVASSDFAVHRVWTQALLIWGRDKGFLEEDEYLEASAKLVGFDYELAWFDPSVAIKAASMALWNADRWPFNKFLNQLSSESMSPKTVLLFASTILNKMYKSTIPLETRQTTMVRILELLLDRNNGLSLVKHLLSNLHSIFGLNVLAVQDCREVGIAWLRAVSYRPRVKFDDQEGLVIRPRDV